MNLVCPNIEYGKCYRMTIMRMSVVHLKEKTIVSKYLENTADFSCLVPTGTATTERRFGTPKLTRNF